MAPAPAAATGPDVAPTPPPMPADLVAEVERIPEIRKEAKEEAQRQIDEIREAIKAAADTAFPSLQAFYETVLDRADGVSSAFSVRNALASGEPCGPSARRIMGVAARVASEAGGLTLDAGAASASRGAS